MVEVSPLGRYRSLGGVGRLFWFLWSAEEGRQEFFCALWTGECEPERFIITEESYLEREKVATSFFERNPVCNCQKVLGREGNCVTIFYLSDFSNGRQRFVQQGLVPFAIFC